jgi:hypothetical protein
VFKELLAQGRLYKKIHQEGFYIIEPGHPSSWTNLFGKCGYHVSITAVRKGMAPELRSTLSDEDAITWYRSRHPLREWNNRQEPGKAVNCYCADYWERGMYWIEDYPRHTEISAYCNVTNGALDQAASRYGNSREIIRLHYRDFMTLAEAVLHYQLMPTALKGKYDWTKIPMPDWSHYTLENLKLEVLVEVEQKRALFPAFDPNKNYEQRDCEKLRVKRCREAWSSLTQKQRDNRMAGIRKWHEERRALKPQQSPKPVDRNLAAIPDERNKKPLGILRIGRQDQNDKHQARPVSEAEVKAAEAPAERQPMSGHTPNQLSLACTQAAAANESATTSAPTSEATATPVGTRA